MAIVWTAEMIEFVRQRAGAKAFASEIAGALCEQGHPVTRCAVIGICRRNKIKLKGGCGGGRRAQGASVPAQKCARPPRARKARAIRVRGESGVAVKPKPPTLRFTETTSDHPIPLGELHSGKCHWPMCGFADRPPYLYCGDAAPEGCSYCERHFQLSINYIKETKHHVADQRVVAA
jgi:hypothetical protein